MAQSDTGDSFSSYDGSDQPQQFEICVNIVEAKNLMWKHKRFMSSFVVLKCQKQKRKTSTKRNVEEPVFGQYFVFEVFACLRDLMNMSLKITMMQKRRIGRAVLLGEHSIDLSAVWARDNHEMMQKWLQLNSPRSSVATGYLKVDIWILTEEIERKIFKKKIMQRTMLDLEDEQRANYSITIYQVDNIPLESELLHQSRKPKIFQNLSIPKTFVRVLFSGLAADTKIQKNTLHPKFNEEISMIETFPNVNDNIRTEVCFSEIGGARVFASFILRLSKISHEGLNGFLPTFGPWPVHLYGNVGAQQTCLSDTGPFYKGRLTMELQTEVPYYQRAIRTVKITPVSALNEEEFGPDENYLLTCVLTEISMVDPQLVGNSCKFAISYGDLPKSTDTKEPSQNLTEDQKRVRQLYDMINNKKAFETEVLPVFNSALGDRCGYCNLGPKFSVLQLLTSLPNFKRTMYIENMQMEIISKLKNTVKHVEEKFAMDDYASLKDLQKELIKSHRVLRSDIKRMVHIISKELKLKNNMMGLHIERMKQLRKDYRAIVPKIPSSGHRYWFDVCQVRQEEEYLSYEEVKKKDVKRKLAATKQVVELLSDLDFEIPSGWPDLVLWLISGDNKVAYYKLNSKDIIYSNIGGLGRKSSRFNNILLKPVKCPKHCKTPETGCFCIGAKIEIYPSQTDIAHKRGKNMYSLPSDFKVETGDKEIITNITGNETSVECVVYAYRAKLSGGIDEFGLANPYVVLHAFHGYNKSQVFCQDLTPVWNQVIRVKTTAYRSKDYLKNNITSFLVEVYHCRYEKERHEIIGRCYIGTKLETNRDKLPDLAWHSLYKGVENIGQILMAATMYLSDDSIEYDPSNVENIPAKMIPETATYKIDIYWWGIREMTTKAITSAYLDMEDLSLKSDPLMKFKKNSNFKNGRTTEIFSAPLKEKYCPPLSIRLFGRSTYGRSVYLGTNVMKNPKKYLIEWLTEANRKKGIHSWKLDIFKTHEPEKKLGANVEETSKYRRYSLCWFLEIIIKYIKKCFMIFSKKKSHEFSQKNDYTVMSLLHRTPKVQTPRSSRRSRKKKKKGKMSTIENAKENILQIKNNWWIRFYSSLGDENIYHDGFPADEKITLFKSELETQPGFEKFKDWCYTMKMYKGKKTGIPDKDIKLQNGIIKAGIAIYKWPPKDKEVAVTPSGVRLENGFYSEHPDNTKTQYRVRLYIVKGVHLMPKNLNNKAMAFVVVHCGKHKFGTRAKHATETLNPNFGSLFEFVAKMPRDYKLVINVSSYSASLVDSLIGSTEIDLEDRIYSKHRAFCGLPCKYSQEGANRWRNLQRPSEILADLCVKNHLPELKMLEGGAVMFNGHKYLEYYKDPTVPDTIKRESTCLRILRQWHKLPICGYRLVPEHVETRSLYHPNKPGIEQGKLLMFLEVFPLKQGAMPPPLDITPEKPEKYEVRVIVWNVNHVKLGGYNFLAGRRATDIYVTAWIGDSSKAQATDVHYRSITGEGNFNWRLIFDINYLFCEQKIVEKVSILDIDTEPEHMIPYLTVQVMDKDTFTLDDFLGSLNLNLSRMPAGALIEKKSSLKAFKAAKQTINLFKTQNTRGWWPFQYMDPVSGAEQHAGNVELEIQIVRKERAKADPVGLGRAPPAPLPEPIRPEAAFNAFMNPFRGFKQMLRVQGSIFSTTFILLALAVAFVVLAFMAFPHVLEDKLMGKLIH